MLAERTGSQARINILAVADQVSEVLYDRFVPSRWQDIDLVLSCGDLPPSYLDFLCSMLDVPVFYVRGNHDDQYPECDYNGCENIHGRIVECKGLRIAGFDGSMRYNGRPYQHTEREMRGIVRRLRWKTRRSVPPDIVITHAPPAGLHDGRDLCHRGFEAFNAVIEAWQPALFLHGHMHAYERSERDTMVGATRVLNVFPYARLSVPAPVASAVTSRVKVTSLAMS